MRSEARKGEIHSGTTIEKDETFGEAWEWVGGALKELREDNIIRVLAKLGDEHFLVSAKANMSAEMLRRDFEGMQPTFRHVPPKTAPKSKIH